MTAARSGRATTRGQSGRAPSRRRPTRSSKNGSSGLLIGGGIAVAVLAVVLMLALGGGGGGQETAEAAAKPAESPAQPPQERREPIAQQGEGRPGSVPDRPAPTIDPAVVEKARAHYEAAVQKWNEGQRARNAGDSTAYTRATKEAFEELQIQRELLRPYTDWYEEADLEGWATPAEYSVGLQRLLDDWDPLYQRVKKLKQAG